MAGNLKKLIMKTFGIGCSFIGSDCCGRGTYENYYCFWDRGKVQYEKGIVGCYQEAIKRRKKAEKDI